MLAALYGEISSLVLYHPPECILRPLTDTFAGLNGRGAKPADATLTALGCSLPEPSEMSRMPRTSLVLDISDDSGTIASQAVYVLSVHYAVCPLVNAPFRQAAQNALTIAITRNDFKTDLFASSSYDTPYSILKSSTVENVRMMG